jgi:NADH:ubiquinone oxidoreductase subunit 3 (subunit A)
MQLTQKKSSPRKEGWRQIECGFNVITPSHIPFSFQFFVIALLFLVFDVEIAIILAYPLEFSSIKNFIFMGGFLMILTIGLVYEWQKSKITWSSWLGKSSLQEFLS